MATYLSSPSLEFSIVKSGNRRERAHNSLAEIALALADGSSLDAVCDALLSGRLSRDSTGPVRAALSNGSPSTEHALQSLQKIWSEDLREISGDGLALALAASAIAAEKRSSQLPYAQVVWTGPKTDGSFLRSTAEVIRELIRGSKEMILVIGYWIVAGGYDGIVHEIISLLAQAVARGVKVIFILDERARGDARTNRQILADAWPKPIPLPEVLTWKLPADDTYLKLHAKVIVADGKDALVTSANLTHHALDRNMEMGVRIVGSPAQFISQHFLGLFASGVLTPFEDATEG